MYNARQILDHKGSEVVCVDADASVLEAARLMNQRRIGSLVVMDRGSLAGIFTERDVLTRIVAAGRDPRMAAVRDVMTRDVYTADPTAQLDSLRDAMRAKRIRHVPIVDDGHCVGLVSIGDINAAESADLAGQVQSLQSYITGT